MILNSYLEPSNWLSQFFDIAICIEAKRKSIARLAGYLLHRYIYETCSPL